MAVGAWFFYNKAKKYIGSADIDLNGATFRMTLHTGAASANVNNLALSTFASIGNEVASGNGYSSSGKNITGVTWTVGASAKEYRFNSSAVFWSGNAGTIPNIKYAVISTGTRLLVACQLSTAQFTLASGNRLTITPSANGIFELNG